MTFTEIDLRMKGVFDQNARWVVKQEAGLLKIAQALTLDSVADKPTHTVYQTRPTCSTKRQNSWLGAQWALASFRCHAAVLS